MQCPNCHMDAVAAAVFCNHCGTPMPVVCTVCDADNPPESHFCHRCGILLSANAAPSASSAVQSREIRIGDIGTDLKTLAVDLTAYSAPRIRRSCIATARNVGIAAAATARHTRNLVVAAAPRVRSLFQRLKPHRPEPLTAIPAGDFADDGETQTKPPPSGPAVSCPRCHQVSEPDALFCFSCGLPLDESEQTSAYRAPAYSGQPAGFWFRLGAWAIDAVILVAIHLSLIAAWPGFSEYYADNGGLWQFHWADLLNFVLNALYATVGVSVWATTIGKRAVGLYVLRPDGGKVGFGRALARFFAGILSFLLFGIGYFMIALRDDKRGLHDLLCDTVVVRK